MKHYVFPILNIYFFLHTKIFYQAYGISQIEHFNRFCLGQYLETCEKKNCIGTASAKSIVILQKKNFFYKDSNISFTRDLAIQLLGKQ